MILQNNRIAEIESMWDALKMCDLLSHFMCFGMMGISKNWKSNAFGWRITGCFGQEDVG